MLSKVVAFMCGIFLLHQFSALPDYHYLLISPFLLFYTQRFPRLWLMCWLLFGFLWAHVWSNMQLKPALLTQYEGQTIVVEGLVASLIQMEEERTRFILQVNKSTLKQQPIQIPKRIQLSWYYPDQRLKAGTQWRFAIRLKKPYGFMSPGAWNYETWAYQHHIGAKGYVRSKDKFAYLSDSFWQAPLLQIRQSWLDQLSIYLKNNPYKGIVFALILGHKKEMTAQQWQVFNRTGTSHLMAISGLHLSLLCVFTYFIARIVWSQSSTLLSFYAAQQAASVIALIVIIVYALLTGFSIPTQRALIMLSIALLAKIACFSYKAKDLFAIAVLLVLLFDPSSIISNGFYLSFIAVAIIYYYLLANRISTSFWVTLVKLQLYINIGFIPVLLLFFSKISLVSPITNIIVVPILSFILLPLLFTACVLYLVLPEIAAALFIAVDFIFDVIWQLMTWLSSFTYAQYTFSRLSPWLVALTLIACLWLLLPKGFPKRIIAIILLIPLYINDKPRISLGEMKLAILDVGQGLSIYVQTKNHSLLYDSGARWSDDFDMGKAVVIPYLEQQGVRALDALVISHADNDHIGGANSIVDHFSVKQIMTSKDHAILNKNSERCRAGRAWDWDQVHFEFLHPDDQTYSANDGSCVLKVTSKSGSVLLTGDIERLTEKKLVDTYAKKLQSDILVVPHHGSGTSSSFKFLRQVKPQTALFSYGYRNRYRLPKKKIWSRYQKLKIQSLSTVEYGTLEIVFYSNRAVRYEITSYRLQTQRFWHTNT